MFIIPKGNLLPAEQVTFAPALGSHLPASIVCKDLSVLDISCTLHHITCSFLGLTSLNMMFSAVIHVVACVSASFLLMAE